MGVWVGIGTSLPPYYIRKRFTELPLDRPPRPPPLFAPRPHAKRTYRRRQCAKNLKMLTRPSFLERFHQKAPMTDLLKTIPPKVILNPHAGLFGAATVANQM